MRFDKRDIEETSKRKRTLSKLRMIMEFFDFDEITTDRILNKIVTEVMANTEYDSHYSWDEIVAINDEVLISVNTYYGNLTYRKNTFENSHEIKYRYDNYHGDKYLAFEPTESDWKIISDCREELFSFVNEDENKTVVIDQELFDKFKKYQEDKRQKQKQKEKKEEEERKAREKQWEEERKAKQKKEEYSYELNEKSLMVEAKEFKVKIESNFKTEDLGINPKTYNYLNKAEAVCTPIRAILSQMLVNSGQIDIDFIDKKHGGKNSKKATLKSEVLSNRIVLCGESFSNVKINRIKEVLLNRMFSKIQGYINNEEQVDRLFKNMSELNPEKIRDEIKKIMLYNAKEYKFIYDTEGLREHKINFWNRGNSQSVKIAVDCDIEDKRLKNGKMSKDKIWKISIGGSSFFNMPFDDIYKIVRTDFKDFVELYAYLSSMAPHLKTEFKDLIKSLILIENL